MAMGFYKAVYKVASATYATVSLAFKADDLNDAAAHATKMASAIGYASPVLIYVGFTGAAKPPGAVGVFTSAGAW